MEKPGRPADDGCPRYRILTTVPKNCGKGPQIQTVDPGSGRRGLGLPVAAADRGRERHRGEGLRLGRRGEPRCDRQPDHMAVVGGAGRLRLLRAAPGDHAATPAVVPPGRRDHHSPVVGCPAGTVRRPTRPRTGCGNCADTGLPPTASRCASPTRPQGRQPRTCTQATTGSARPDRRTSSHSSIRYRDVDSRSSRRRATCRTAPQPRRSSPVGRSERRRRISLNSCSRCSGGIAMCPEKVLSSRT
jgi:hypothetical protein